MAALIGKAAANNWKRATFGHHDNGTLDWQRESLHAREQRTKANSMDSVGDAQACDFSDDPLDALNEVPELNLMHVEERTTGTDDLPVARLYNPNKQKLADLCRLQPGNANRVLRHELSQRSQLDTVLLSMKKRIQRQGPAQRLGRRDSRRITRALNRAMLSGASRQVWLRCRAVLLLDLHCLIWHKTNTPMRALEISTSVHVTSCDGLDERG